MIPGTANRNIVGNRGAPTNGEPVAVSELSSLAALALTELN